MRKYVLLLAILALPGMSFGQTNTQLDIVYNAATAAPLVGGVVQFDPGVHSSIIFDVVFQNPLSQSVTGLQYLIDLAPVAEEANWSWDAGTPWTNGTLFSAGMWQAGVQFGGAGLAMNVWGSPEAVFVGASPAITTGGLVATYEIVATGGTLSNFSIGVPTGSPPADAVPVGLLDPGIFLPVNIVPEPASVLLLLGALPFLRRRR
jgi:hypothetical protein